MSDFDWSDAFQVYSFDYNGKTIYLRECPAGEYIDNRTDILNKQREVDVNKAQSVLYENAAKSICDSSGKLIFGGSPNNVKEKVPEMLFKFIKDRMKEINGSVDEAVDEGNSES